MMTILYRGGLRWILGGGGVLLSRGDGRLAIPLGIVGGAMAESG